MFSGLVVGRCPWVIFSSNAPTKSTDDFSLRATRIQCLIRIRSYQVNIIRSGKKANVHGHVKSVSVWSD